jgi:hypothetical protein
MAWYLMISSGMFKPNDVVGKTLYCVILFVSIMFRADSNCTRDTICCVLVAGPGVFIFTLDWAGVDVAELAGAEASEPPELVGSGVVGADTVALTV